MEGTDDVNLVGGKGANLISLIELPFAIPKGFIINTRAHEYFIESSSHETELKNLLFLGYTPKDVLGLSKKIFDLIDQTPLPVDLENAVKWGLNELKKQIKASSPFFAIRSSATIEDSKKSSFAGQLESFLYNNTLEEILTSMKGCWKSL